ncbi:hypothetical protein BsWGS_17796 [Bradybaena similaris]
MLHVTPSVGLAKFLWSKPTQSKPAAMTVSANGEDGSEVTKPVPMTIAASNPNVAGQGQNMSGVMMNSSEEDTAIHKIAGLKEFWSRQMKTQEGKWKQHYEQIMSSQRNIDTEVVQVDWEAVRERLAWRWTASHEKPEDVSSEEWQKLEELRLRPWLIYTYCGLYTKLFLDPESRPIFQEFDFY